MLRIVPALAALASALSLTGCLMGGSDEGATPSAPKGALTYSTPFTVQGDRILTPERKTVYLRCEGSEGTHDTATENATSVRFKVTGARLEILSEPDPEQPFPEPPTRIIATRLGGGSGLEGAWHVDSMVEVAPAGATPAELEEIDTVNAYMRRMLARDDMSYRFAGATLEVYEDRDLAGEFVEDWNAVRFLGPQSDADRYDIAVKALDNATVELKGRKSGETVRLTLPPSGDRIYVSNNAAHAKHTFQSEPVTCPNEFEPEWYADFLNANLKPDALPKASTRPPRPVLPRLPFGI